MNKPQWLMLGLLTLVIGCLRNPSDPLDSGKTGSAEIRWPEVPPEAFATPADSLGLEFEIVVEGAGMAARSQRWLAFAYGGKSVTVEAIPAGPGRTFTGRILSNGKVTHEGKFTTAIAAGQTAYVPLLLKDVRTGRAEICVEVEGWPAPKCKSIGPPVDSLLLGCWNLTTSTGLDGKLSLGPNGDSALMGTFIDRNGARYQAFGWPGENWTLQLFLSDSLKMGLEAVSIRVDSIADVRPLSTTVQSVLYGSVLDPTLTRAIGQATAFSTFCRVPPDTIIVESALVGCWNVKTSGGWTGRLSLVRSRDSSTGETRVTGHFEFPDSGAAKVSVHRDSNGALDLDMEWPLAMRVERIDSSTFSGTLWNPGYTMNLGTMSGIRIPCDAQPDSFPHFEGCWNFATTLGEISGFLSLDRRNNTTINGFLRVLPDSSIYWAQVQPYGSQWVLGFSSSLMMPVPPDSVVDSTHAVCYPYLSPQCPYLPGSHNRPSVFYVTLDSLQHYSAIPYGPVGGPLESVSRISGTMLDSTLTGVLGRAEGLSITCISNPPDTLPGSRGEIKPALH